MTSITAQQTKLDLELVSKENRLDIGKCNGRIPRGLKPKEETFQVVLDALALTPCYPTFVITVDVPEMHQSWRTFAALINRSLSRKTTALDKLRIVIREPPMETQPKRKEKGGCCSCNDKECSELENDSEEHESDSEQDTDGSELDSESDQQDDDDEVKDDDDDEVKDDDEYDDNDVDKFEGDEDRGMDSDDIQDKKADKTEVYVTSSSRSSDLASKFLNFLDIHPADTEIFSPMDVYVHHEVPRIHTSIFLVVPVLVIPEASPVYMNIPQSSQTFTSLPLQSTLSPLPTTETTNIPTLILNFASVFRFNNRVIALEKNVAELKNDPLHTQVTVLVDYHLETRMGATREEFMNFLSTSLTDRITEQRSRNDKDKNEGPSARSDRGLKKRNTSKDVEPTTCLKTKDSSSRSSKGSKPQPKSFGKSVHVKEPKFKVGHIDTPQGQKGNQESTNPDWNEDKTPQKGPTQNWLMTLAASNSTGKSLKEFDEFIRTSIDLSSYILNCLKIENLTQEILLGSAFRLLKGTRSNYAKLEYDFEECYKALSEKLDWENPEGIEFFINNDLKYLEGGISTMTYTMSTTKTKGAQYDLQGIKDMVPKIWRPVKVAFDKYTLWGISHWRDQCKTFYTYARGIQSKGYVYSTKCILVVTQVLIIRKHGYGFLEEIVNQLINISGDDVADFAITLRMFTRSLVIQKRVKDL
uniref:Uncharacterized protein n=1 Tax=Tanacetum cinerariifolium TaxID=118510 RepID=A0A699GR24_TANCI|nr:hypothetical protein [Tanacetum cinerariifolium]